MQPPMMRIPKALFCAAAAAILLFVVLGWLREIQGQLHAFDTGLYMQVLHNIMARGDLASSVTGEQNFLAHHFQPVLFVLAPIFAVQPMATTLFLISGLAVLGAVYLLSQQFTREGLPAWVTIGVACSLVFWPAINSRLYHSFVPEVIALPALTVIAQILAQSRKLANRQFWQFLFWGVVASSCKKIF
jgi:uncharacterized membrane protein